MRRYLVPVGILIALLFFAGRAGAVHISFSTGDHIELQDDWVVIHPHGSPEAEISPEGELRIDGRRVVVGEHDRQLLVRFNEAYHGIEEGAISVGIRGAAIGISALGAVVVALSTGDEDSARRIVEPQARRLKADARALCREVEALREVGDQLAADLPELQPYLLLDDDDRSHCRIED